MVNFSETNLGQYKIYLKDVDGQLMSAKVSCSCRDWIEKGRHNTQCQTTLKWQNNELKSDDWNFFDSFKAIRKKLVSYKLVPVCYAAHRRLILSGMCMSMSLGRKAYKVSRDGTLMRPTVLIFSSGDDIEPVSVEEQQSFQMQWRAEH